MKGFSVFVALLLAVGTSVAQPIFVLAPDHTFGGFIGGTLRFGNLYGQRAILAGAATAIVVDRRLMVGLEGATLTDNVEIHPTTESRASLRMLYGGLLVSYAIGAERPVHAIVRATVGGGGVRAMGRTATTPPWALLVLMIDMPVDGPDDAFFLVEPGIGIEAALGAHVRIELSALYRVVVGIESEGLDNVGVGGASLALTTKLGLW